VKNPQKIMGKTSEKIVRLADLPLDFPCLSNYDE
jgi:hypothetical protein